MNYALIENGVVVNLIRLLEWNSADFPDAVPVGDLSVAIGDTYEDGAFYHDGARVRSALEIAQAEAEDMRAALELLGVSV